MKTKILLIASLLILSFCSFFRVMPESTLKAHWIEQLEKDGKYLVLQRGDEAWNIYDVHVRYEILRAKLDIQLGYHAKYINPKVDGLNKFDKGREPDVINSIHFFTADTSFNSLDSLITIPLSSIYEIRSYEYAKAPSRASRIVPVVVLPIVGFAILVVAVIS